MNMDSSENQKKIDQLCINTIRTLSIDAIEKSNSGHPGAPMGLAPAGYVLWTRVMKHNPQNPDWPDRDRFVLSGGHASMLLYSLLYLTGYDLSLDDIKNFRQWGARTPGHPEYGHTPGVETTTGPLGQGFANAVGMAMAEQSLAARFNKPDSEIVDHHTYMICGDGDLMEGVASEAASLAGHLGLSKLICLYDDNGISIEGSTDISFTENVASRFESYHWQVIKVDNGNDIDSIQHALEQAKAENERPSIILLHTDIAFGSPNKQGTSDAHGAPLGEEETILTKKNLGCPPDATFCVPEKVLDFCRECIDRGSNAESCWNEKYIKYSDSYPDLSEKWNNAMNGKLPANWENSLPSFSPEDGPIATRAASGTVLNAIADIYPELIGGSADLAPSNKTVINSSHDFQKNSRDGRNIRFGVREHAMGGIMNGMFLHKGIRPYGGTFLVFADYMRPSIRLAGLMKLPVIYVFTHDSIAVGEDGPTHQPVEHVASLRAIPGLTVIRPSDALETVEAWRKTIETSDGPVALILSRQKLPVLDRNIYATANELSNGAYVLSDCSGIPDLILIATGSEIHITLDARAVLKDKGIHTRVVCMPSWELFEKTPREYRDKVLPPDVTNRIAIEAGLPMGWERYIGSNGVTIAISDFGVSAPGGIVLEKFGFTSENIVNKAMALLEK